MDEGECQHIRVLTLFTVLQEDYEIFDLVSAVEESEGLDRLSTVMSLLIFHTAGTGTTFYSWLDVPHTATTNEISKAYRKLSMQLQYVPPQKVFDSDDERCPSVLTRIRTCKTFTSGSLG
jgi:hypothetical protein